MNTCKHSAHTAREPRGRDTARTYTSRDGRLVHFFENMQALSPSTTDRSGREKNTAAIDDLRSMQVHVSANKSGPFLVGEASLC